MATLTITVDLLASTPDDEIEQLLYQHVLALQSQAPERLDTLPVAIAANFIAVLMDNEVTNGGLNQFWFNAPDFAADAASAFEDLEIPGAADLARRASEVFETVRDRHDAARRDGSIESFIETCKNSPFSDLDREYFSHSAEWQQARIAFIRRNPLLFVHN